MRILVNEFCGHAFQIELSRELARRGHRVLHLYFADNCSTPKGNVDADRQRSPYFAIEGLHLGCGFSKHSLLTRRRVDIAYGNAVAAHVASFAPDVVLSANMPLDAQKRLQFATRRHEARFVFWLQDVYSAAVRFVFRRRLRLLAPLAGAYYQWLEKRLLANSDHVVCISPAFASTARTWGVDPSRISVIENWSPLRDVVPAAKDNAWSRQQGVAQKFCFMYSGTLGMKHRPELLLALARELRQRGNACLVVVAAGAGADWLRSNAQSMGCDTLLLLPFQPYERISDMLGAADVLIALLDSEAGEFAVPSKVLTYLCAGRPLLLAAPAANHAAEVVRRAKCGIVVSPDNPTAFVDAAGRLVSDPELRLHYAANGRAYAQRAFEIAPIADRFLEVLTPARSFARARFDLSPTHPYHQEWDL